MSDRKIKIKKKILKKVHPDFFVKNVSEKIYQKCFQEFIFKKIYSAGFFSSAALSRFTLASRSLRSSTSTGE
jgi:hypothetical protein